METKERAVVMLPGLPAFITIIILGILNLFIFAMGDGLGAVFGIIIGIGLFFSLTGLFIVQPNQAVVATLFGKYVGSCRANGWYWTNPFTSRQGISLRIRNFNSERLKVNDLDGSPIEIAAVIVWRVVDTARAIFDVEDYAHFVAIQSETALRHLASRYPYDGNPETISLRAHPDEVSEALCKELGDRLIHAGVEVLEARLSHLAYSPEIAGAMLQRQQASAIIAARQKIVEGAVGMVQMALEKLANDKIVELSEDRKAQMVSNLLVVLTSERGTQPTVSTGNNS